MKNFDKIKAAQEESRAAVFTAMKEGTPEEQEKALNSFLEGIQSSVMDLANSTNKELVEAGNDTNVLVNRGILKPITSDERQYFNAVIEKQSFDNIEEVMPTTIIQTVLSDLHREHVLLQYIDLKDTKALAKFIFAKPTAATAFWGDICSDIRQMIIDGFTIIEAAANKLSGFVPLCKGMLELGPEWLAAYVIECMYEAMSVELEIGIIRGRGKGKFEPVGMSMKLTGAVDGVHSPKTPIEVTSLNPDQLGPIMATFAKNRTLKGEMIFIVHPFTYWAKVFPALAAKSANQEWVLDRLPIGVKIVESYACDEDRAVMGVGKNYFFGVAGKTRINKYTETLAIEDMDLFIAKFYGYGQPKDENAFEVLDISKIKPLLYPSVGNASQGSGDAMRMSVQENSEVVALRAEVAALTELVSKQGDDPEEPEKNSKVAKNKKADS